MGNEKVMNRWLVVVGAILIQLALGAIYAWSVFTGILKRSVEDGGYGFSASETQWVFSVGLASFALIMLVAGRWQAKVGPRLVAVVGGLVLGAGYILGGFLGQSFWPQLICIGLVGGAGIGLAYVVPIAVGVKWFPDKKGMITGLAVAGFGFGATIWIKFGDTWIWQGGLLAKMDGFLGLPGVQAVFVLYGIIFLLFVLLGSLVMVNPPEGWKPEGWNPESATGVAAATTGTRDLTVGQMTATPQYWSLLLMFTGSAMAGLMVIGCIKLFGMDSLVHSGAKPDKVAAGMTASTAIALYAILNGLGRIVWGVVSDKIGRKAALFLMCLAQGVMMLLFFRVGMTPIGLIVGACIIGFNFGGNFALFPAATADLFGNKRVGTNYPLVFLAYGIAGIVGPQIAGYFKDNAAGDVNAWKMPFMIAGIACLVAAFLAITLKSPKSDQAAA